MMTNRSESTSRIFVSYSHRGNGPKWKAALLEALQVFERHQLLDVWEDGKIRVSSFWDDDITQAMKSARLAVLLLTDEALKSEYIVSRELPVLRDRRDDERLPVIPVICEPCDWKAHDWIRATQAPNGSNPLSELSQDDIRRAFRALATDIAEQISQLTFAELASADRLPTPTLTYLDRFPIDSGAGLGHQKLIGREQELVLLDLAFAQAHTAIVSLVAWGGVGKTMLVQHWLQRLRREGWFGSRRVYAWGFYSQGTKEDRLASEDLFLAHALEWFGVQCEPTLSPWDKGHLLADAIARQPTLLILDGIEPLQHPPGPMGGQLRAPGLQSLLKQLARKANATEHRGLCLVTTREPLTDLADFQRREGAAWGSVLRVDLGNLTEEAGAALLHHAGAKQAGVAEIKADDAELLAASREVDGHALTLNLLGRFLARAHDSDIRRRDLVKFEEADRKEQGGTTFKMLAAFESWFAKGGELGARQLTVLRMLGLFDRPAEAGCIAALRKPPAIANLTAPCFQITRGFLGWRQRHQPIPDEDWNTAISFLAEFGLLVIQFDAENRDRLLDCHPLIREHFANQVRNDYSESFRAAHRRLYQHLCENTPNKPQPTFEDLDPLYQAVMHGCQSGMQQEACDKVYHDRILRGTGPGGFFSSSKLGAVGADLAALAAFFEEPWSQPSRNLKLPDQVWLLSQAAVRLRAIGRLSEAVEPMRVVLNHDIYVKRWKDAATSAGILSELEVMLGELGQAVADVRDAIEFANLGGAAFLKTALRAVMADVLHQAGRRAESEALFVEAEWMQGMREPPFPLLYSVQGFKFADLILAPAERSAWHSLVDSPSGGTRNSPKKNEGGTTNHKALAAYTEAERRAKLLFRWRAGTIWNANHDSVLSIALDHLTLARAALYRALLTPNPQSEIGNQHSEIHTALAKLREANDCGYFPQALLTAALHAAAVLGQPDEAWHFLEEAQLIAERGPMPLYLADIHLHRARLFFREMRYPWKSPQGDLAAAEKLINNCGYHRRDEELADAKRAILGDGN